MCVWAYLLPACGDGVGLALGCSSSCIACNILALLVAVCGSLFAYYSFACGGLPFVPYASRWVWVRHVCLMCFCTCVLFFLVVVCGSPRASCPPCLASFVFLHTKLLARGSGGLVALAAVCTGGHTFRALFAPCVTGRAGGGWARLGYASWSPFTFVGAVPVLISCSLHSAAWHVTFLHLCLGGRCGGCRLCMLCIFSFCSCLFTGVVLSLGCVWPPACVLLSFVCFVFPRLAPSYHFALPWR